MCVHTNWNLQVIPIYRVAMYSNKAITNKIPAAFWHVNMSTKSTCTNILKTGMCTFKFLLHYVCMLHHCT